MKSRADGRPLADFKHLCRQRNRNHDYDCFFVCSAWNDTSVTQIWYSLSRACFTEVCYHAGCECLWYSCGCLWYSCGWFITGCRMLSHNSVFVSQHFVWCPPAPSHQVSSGCSRTWCRLLPVFTTCLAINTSVTEIDAVTSAASFVLKETWWPVCRGG